MFEEQSRRTIQTGASRNYIVIIGKWQDSYEATIQWMEELPRLKDYPHIKRGKVAQEKLEGANSHDEALQAARQWIAENDEDGRVSTEY